MLREELQLLQEPGSYVGEVVKVMGKNKVLVKVLSFFTASFSNWNPCDAYNFFSMTIKMMIKGFFLLLRK